MPNESTQGAWAMETEMGWITTYLVPSAIVAYAIRIEIALRAIHSNRDIKEMVALMRWLAEEQTGKRPPPYVKGG